MFNCRERLLPFRLNLQGLDIHTQKAKLAQSIHNISPQIKRFVVVTDRVANYHSACSLLADIHPECSCIHLCTSNKKLLQSVSPEQIQDLPSNYRSYDYTGTAYLLTDVSFTHITHMFMASVKAFPSDAFYIFAICFLPRPQFKSSFIAYVRFGVGHASFKASLARLLRVLLLLIKLQPPKFYSFCPNDRTTYMCPHISSICQTLNLVDSDIFATSTLTTTNEFISGDNLIYIDGNEELSDSACLMLKDIFKALHSISGKIIYIRIHPKSAPLRSKLFMATLNTPHVKFTSMTPTVSDTIIGIASSALFTFHSRNIINLSQIIEPSHKNYNRVNAFCYFAAMIHFWRAFQKNIYIPSTILEIEQLLS